MSTPFDIEEPYPGWAQDSRAPLILGVMGPMTSLANLFGIARIYSRLISLKRIGVDDYTIIASIILLLPYLALVAIAVSYGAGRHQQTLSPENAQYPRFYIWISFLPGIAWRKKLALSSSLGFGYCAGGVAAYKCYTLSKPPGPGDFTYFAYRIILWTNIEASCVIIGACIPCLFPLVKKVFGASALSGGTGKQDDNQVGGSNKAIITIGSPLREIRRAPRSPFGLSELDTITDNSKPDVLELSIHASTTELRVDDKLAELEWQQQN